MPEPKTRFGLFGSKKIKMGNIHNQKTVRNRLVSVCDFRLKCNENRLLAISQPMFAIFGFSVALIQNLKKYESVFVAGSLTKLRIQSIIHVVSK